MKKEERLTNAIDRLTAQVADGDIAKVMAGLQILAAAMDELRDEQAALLAGVQQLLVAAAVDGNPMHEATPPSADQPPAFESSFSDYEAGELFADEPGYDLTIHFADERSIDWYRVWSFTDAGHALHVILEACARIHLKQEADCLTFRRDFDSVTVYAKHRDILQRLHDQFSSATATNAEAMKLLETMNHGLKNP